MDIKLNNVHYKEFQKKKKKLVIPPKKSLLNY